MLKIENDTGNHTPAFEVQSAVSGKNVGDIFVRYDLGLDNLPVSSVNTALKKMDCVQPYGKSKDPISAQTMTVYKKIDDPRIHLTGTPENREVKKPGSCNDCGYAKSTGHACIILLEYKKLNNLGLTNR